MSKGIAEMNHSTWKALLPGILILVWGLVFLLPDTIVAQETRSADPSIPALSLKDCLDKAMTDNPLLSEAKLAVAASDKNIDSARGKHLPRLSVDGNYTARQDPIPFIPAQSLTIFPHFANEFATWAVAMQLPIYQGNQVVNGVKLAEIRKSLQEDNLSLTRNEIIANVVNTYNKLLQLSKLQEASQSSVRALADQMKQSQLLFDVGRIAKVDLLKVDVQLSNERQRLLSIDEAIDNLSGTLRYLMGEQIRGPAEAVSLSDTLTLHEFSADFEKGLETAKLKRPEYLIASKAVAEAGVNRDITKGKLFPTVGAVAGYMDQYGFNPSSYSEANWFTGVNVSIPIFDKSLYDDVARERILEDKAGKRLTAVENQIRVDIQSALSSMRESRNRVLTTARAVEQAAESFRIEQEKYKSGAGAVTDLLLAEAAYVNAVANHSQALFDYNAALVAYRKVTGTLEDYLQ
jgi:outer membrane protein